MVFFSCTARLDMGVGEDVDFKKKQDEIQVRVRSDRGNEVHERERTRVGNRGN